MKTKTIGELLREARQAHRVKVLDLAQRTRIRPEYLEALEQNRFQELPSATFVKGYIRSYAHLFGVEAAPLIALLRRDFKESAKGTLVPREFIKPVLKKRAFWTPVTAAVLVLAAICVAVFGYIGVQWYHFNQPPALVVQQPADHATVASQVTVTGQTSPEAQVSVNAQPVALDQQGNFQTQVFIPREGISSITVEAIDRRGKTNLVQRTVYVQF